MNAEKVFVRSSCLVLGITAMAKLVSVFGDAKALELDDPLLIWSNRSTLILAAIVEIIVVCLLLSKASSLFKCSTILLISLSFLNFRFASWLMGAVTPCPCMGNMYAVIGIKPADIDFLMKLVLLLLLGCSIYFVSLHCSMRWRAAKCGLPCDKVRLGNPSPSEAKEG